MNVVACNNFGLMTSESDFWMSGYLEITASVIMAIILIVYLFFIYLSYRQIVVPEPFYRNGVSSHYNCVDIVQQYLAFKGINDVGVQKKITHTHPFSNYRNGTITMNDLPLFHPPYQLTGMGLDYVLGRTFIAMQQHLKESDYFIYRMVGFVLPVFCLALFCLLFLLNIILGILWQEMGDLLTNNSFFYALVHFKILLIIIFVCWIFYFACAAFSVYVKLNMENDYEEDIRKFVKSKYFDLYGDFLIARRYSRSIRITYAVGIGWLLKHDYRYLGPFGYF